MVLGITGGLASGKSTVAAAFARRGARVISADAIAHELTLPGSALTRAVLERFGSGFGRSEEANALDRRKLAALIFSDEVARRDLEAITHPPIVSRMRDEIARLTALEPRGLVVVEIPLLYECGLEGLVDKVVVASCDSQTQAQRLCEREPELNIAQARKRIETQMPLADKARRADFVVDASGPPEGVEAQVNLLIDAMSKV